MTIAKKLKINGTPGASLTINGTAGGTLRVSPPLSSDTSLAVWSYTDGSGSHAVSNDRTYYIANEYSNTAALAFVQTPTDGGASVSQLSGSALNVGNNTYTIRVTAADGSTRNYSITLNRAAGGGGGGGGGG
jgi:hypothetical protein